MRPIRGILLDLDGTLVESNDAHAKAWTLALNEAGHKVTFNDIRPLIGMGGDKLLPKVCGMDAESKEGKGISKRRGEIFLQNFFPKLQATNGAERLLRLLKQRGFKMAVASSSKKDELEPLLKVCNADRYIEDSTSSDDAQNSKPDPDILHAALRTIGLEADETVMLGDTPYDVVASRTAGIRIIGFTCGGWTKNELKADAVYRDPQDLCDSLDQSILAMAG